MYDKFEKLLKERKITRFRVAKDTGIAQSTLAEWKSGRSQPKLDKLIKLSNYFQVPIEYFIGETGK